MYSIWPDCCSSASAWLQPVGPATAIHRRHGHLVETLCPARTQVEDTRLLGVIEKEQIDLGHILDVDKITHLTAIGIAMRTCKQLHLALGSVLIEIMERDRCHAPLVLLARAINVEVAEPDDLR